MDGQTEGLMSQSKHEWTERGLDGQTIGWIHKQMEKLTKWRLG